MQFKKIELTRDNLYEALAQGLTLTEYLENQDPSGEYPDVPMDAFERQLLARGIFTGQEGKASFLEAFYEESNRILFPEFIDRNVRMGMTMGRNQVQIEDLVHTATEIDAGTYQSALVDLTKKPKVKKVGEGSDFPTVKIYLSDKTIYLGKHGCRILSTYEYRRRVKVNIFAKLLQFIGVQLRKDITDLGIAVAIDGTGNSDAAPEVEYSSFDFAALSGFQTGFMPYECSLWIASATICNSILTMDAFGRQNAGFEYARTGNWITPLGNKLRWSDYSGLSTDKLLGVDQRFCLEKITESGASLTEVDKIIGNQTDEIVISMVVGFAKTFKESAKVLKPAAG